MTLPKEIEKLRGTELAEFKKVFCSTMFSEQIYKFHGDWMGVAFMDGFNAGFLAFRDSEMMREVVEEMTLIVENDEFDTTKEVLDKYRKWIGTPG